MPSCTVEAMNTTEVADAYLSRWPNQEALFRNARNGLGLGQTHGYSGEWVQNISLDTHLEKARRRVLRAEQAYKEAERHRTRVEALAKTCESAEEKMTLSVLAYAAKQEAARTGKMLKQATQDLAKTEALPRLIFERDTARENVVTALRMHLFFLIEFVLREFFGGLSIELRTFVEAFVSMPVTVLTSDRTLIYQVEADPRFADRNKLMAQACKAVNSRKIHRGKRRLVFEMVEPQKPVRRTPMRVN